jgi:hypothetical protein
MLSIVASLVLLGSMGALGVALLTRFGRHLTPLERFAYGSPVGMVIGTLAMIPVATVVGFRVEVVIADAFACLLGAIWLAGRQPVDRLRLPRSRPRWRTIAPILVIGTFAIRWVFYWRDAIQMRPTGMWAGHINLWGDWPVHFGILSSFAYGANFPPDHPRFADHAFAYHYLSDMTAAAQVVLGMDPAAALVLHSFIGCVLVAIGVYAFARRFLRDRGAATLAVILFLLGGGVGWIATAAAFDTSNDLIGTLSKLAWERHVQKDLNLQFVNMFFGFMTSQRAFLYGFPLAFAIVATLMVAVRRHGQDRRLFIVAGAIAGLLPLAHLGTLLSLAIVTPVLFLLFPSRRWFWFFAVWVAVALPQLLTQLGGGAGALAAIRIQFGWVASPDPWPWFWVKNLGFFLPLAIGGLLGRRVLPPRSMRFAWAFMALFVAVNTVVFQPWDWDNHKLLVYWFLMVVLASAAALARLWRARPRFAARAVVLSLILTMTLSGVLEDIGTALGQSTYKMLEPDQIRLAAEIRARTAPDAMFISGMQNHDPVAMLTGRRIYIGYKNWLWTEGIPYEARTAEAARIYRAEPGTESLMARLGIDYVVIGPHERSDLDANEAAFEARYPVLVTVGDWTVYDVRGAVP